MGYLIQGFIFSKPGVLVCIGCPLLLDKVKRPIAFPSAYDAFDHAVFDHPP